MFTFQGKMNEWYNYQAFKATAKFEISQQCYFNPSYAFLLLKAVKFLRNTQSHFPAQRRGREEENKDIVFRVKEGRKLRLAKKG